MNKVLKSFVALIGGIESIFHLLSPILVCFIWVSLFPSNSNWLFLSLGLVASLFRGIKVGGWLNNE